MESNTHLGLQLLDLLVEIAIFTPPFMKSAAYIFLPLKVVAILVGVLLAVILHRRVSTKRKENLLSRLPFCINLGAFVAAFAAAEAMFYILDTPSTLQWVVEYILFFYVNLNIGLIIALIIFLVPWAKIKPLASLFSRHDDGPTT